MQIIKMEVPGNGFCQGMNFGISVGCLQSNDAILCLPRRQSTRKIISESKTIFNKSSLLEIGNGLCCLRRLFSEEKAEFCKHLTAVSEALLSSLAFNRPFNFKRRLVLFANFCIQATRINLVYGENRVRMSKYPVYLINISCQG